MTLRTIALIAIAPVCQLSLPKKINSCKRRIEKFKTLMTLLMIALAQMYLLCLLKKTKSLQRSIEKMNDLELTYLSQI